MELVMNTDIYLVKRAGSGEAAAFHQIVEQNKKKIFYLAYDLTGSIEDAEDLSQEVFLKAYRSIKTFKGNASLGSWLYRITLNAFLDRKRKLSFKMERQQQSLEERVASESLLDGRGSGHSANQPKGESAATNETPEKYAQKKQIQVHVDTALEKLTPRERAVFVMRHYQEMPGKQVATLLSISEGTVKSLLYRAIKKLQVLLSDYRELQEPGITASANTRVKAREI